MREWFRRERPALIEGAICAAIVLATMSLCIWGW